MTSLGHNELSNTDITFSVIEQTMFKTDPEVGNPLVSVILAGLPSHSSYPLWSWEPFQYQIIRPILKKSQRLGRVRLGVEMIVLKFGGWLGSKAAELSAKCQSNRKTLTINLMPSIFFRSYIRSLDIEPASCWYMCLPDLTCLFIMIWHAISVRPPLIDPLTWTEGH